MTNSDLFTGTSNPAEAWHNNEAHGGLFGVYMNKDGIADCSYVQGFTIWKCWDYGIYFQVRFLFLIIMGIRLQTLQFDFLTFTCSEAAYSRVVCMYWSYSITLDFQTYTSVHISNVTLVDNGMGIIPLIYEPPSLSHMYSNKTVQIQVRNIFIWI